MEPTTPSAENAAPEEGALSTAPNPEKAAAAKELVTGILERMGVQAEIAVDDRPDGIHLELKVTQGAEVLGHARRGGVVESIGYLVNKSINRDEQGRKWVFVGLSGEPSAEAAAAPVGNVDPALKAMAEELVAKARRMGGAAWAGPIPASMRGLQAALASLPGVRVRAEGEGIHRRLVIEAS